MAMAAVMVVLGRVGRVRVLRYLEVVYGGLVYMRGDTDLD